MQDLRLASIHCGSGLARECVLSVNEDASCAGLIASKLAPTGTVFQRSRYGISTFTAPVGQSFSQGMQYQHSSNAM
ncbi:hypothetical protein D3C76_475970 [compost metagenome]|jgi:hypothetical protein